ncbi:MAG: EamA family transporter [Terrimicrobiaceae bacterium]|nr:EamA family transporter [Terrimicrobiaceae bacterium]
MSPAAIALPLSAAFIYVVATLVIKRAVANGASSREVNFSVNLAMGVVMQAFWMLESASPVWWQPLACGILFFSGQCLTFEALSRGDVSVATPLMGTKILFIALFAAVLFGVDAGWQWWTAIGLSTLAVGLITLHPGNRRGNNAGFTAILAVLSAMVFGLTDLLLQVWCEPETMGRFLATMFIVNAFCSSAWYFVEAPGKWLPVRAARPWLAGSALLLATQVVLLAIALSLFNDAAATNILYASRSLWSVVLAWWAGKWFGARDAEAGTMVMGLRLAGAVLLFASIVLIVAGG